MHSRNNKQTRLYSFCKLVTQANIVLLHSFQSTSTYMYIQVCYASGVVHYCESILKGEHNSTQYTFFAYTQNIHSLSSQSVSIYWSQHWLRMHQELIKIKGHVAVYVSCVSFLSQWALLLADGETLKLTGMELSLFYQKLNLQFSMTFSLKPKTN